jgi:hypothetical protein
MAIDLFLFQGAIRGGQAFLSLLRLSWLPALILTAVPATSGG